MLVDLAPSQIDEINAFMGGGSEIAQLISLIENKGQKSDYITRLSTGLFQITGFNFGMCINGILENSYPEFDMNTIRFGIKLIEQEKEKGTITTHREKQLSDFLAIDISRIEKCSKSNTIPNSYGIIDKPTDILDMWNFTDDPRYFMITVTEIKRENQPASGGWRYHKWGPYYGNQNPQNEYLFDDTHIDSVWVYHIYQIKDDGVISKQRQDDGSCLLINGD